MKEFFKPSRGKLIIFGGLAAIYIVGFYLSFRSPFSDVPVGLTVIWYIFILVLLLPFVDPEVKTGMGGIGRELHATMWVVAHILSLGILYLFSCLVMEILGLFRKKKSLV